MTVHRLFWIPKWYISVSRRIQRASVVCRLLPPAMPLSVTAMEITDPQIHYVSDREVPETNSQALVIFQ
jgi:hypothetical protein